MIVSLKYLNLLFAAGTLLWAPACSNDTAEPSYTPLKQIERLSTSILEPSGICFDENREGFWIVDGSRQKVYHTTLTGSIDSTLPFTGTDLEAVYYHESDRTLWVGDERLNRIYGFNQNAEIIKEFSLDISEDSNSGIEGITRDHNGNFWIVNEKSPALVVETDINGTILSRHSINFAKDLSDLYFDSTANSFILLSDESKAIFYWSPETGLSEAYSLPKRKYEGLAYDPLSKKFYLVNDEDGTLEVFVK